MLASDLIGGQVLPLLPYPHHLTYRHLLLPPSVPRPPTRPEASISGKPPIIFHQSYITKLWELILAS